MGRHKRRVLSRLVMEYLVDLYGVNPDIPIPMVKVLNSRGRPLMGQYNPGSNKIIVFYDKCGDVKMFIRSMIHEYIHYLQPMDKYPIFNLLYGYWKNPQEVEARYHEVVYSHCWKKIKIRLYDR
jgi:hypothetical protein